METLLCYKVFGDPVTHSLSPQIHRLFATQLNMTLSYEKQTVSLKEFPHALADFRAQGGQGVNITLPLKEVAYTLCQRTTSAAQHAQAVNTLYWDKNNELCGDNTDGMGLLNDLKKHYGDSLEGKKILVLGAGGAALGIIPALLTQHTQTVFVANRTISRAYDVVKKLSHPRLKVISLALLNASSGGLLFDIIINTTSASLHNEIVPLAAWVIKDRFIYDLVYNLDKPTVFVQFAKLQGAKAAHDGLGMLIEQAAESFYRWHHKRPDTQSVHLFFRST